MHKVSQIGTMPWVSSIFDSVLIRSFLGCDVSEPGFGRLFHVDVNYNHIYLVNIIVALYYNIIVVLQNVLKQI